MLVTARHVHMLELLSNVFEPRHIDRSNVAMSARAEEQEASYALWVDSRDGRETSVERDTR